jgi:hypothetical protein
MDESKPISGFAQRFVARKLQEYRQESARGSGLYYELFSQNFTDSVDRLAAMTKRPDLREHIRAEAAKTGHYMGEEARQGRWHYDVEAGDVVWREKAPVMRNGGQKEPASGGIRKTVWRGPWVDSPDGRQVRGLVGRTPAGEYKAGQGVIEEKIDRNGGVSYSPEALTWSESTYAHKEQAIFVARKCAAQTVKDARQFHDDPPGLYAATEKDAASKYGSQDYAGDLVKRLRLGRSQ